MPYKGNSLAPADNLDARFAKSSLPEVCSFLKWSIKRLAIFLSDFPSPLLALRFPKHPTLQGGYQGLGVHPFQYKSVRVGTRSLIACLAAHRCVQHQEQDFIAK